MVPGATYGAVDDETVRQGASIVGAVVNGLSNHGSDASWKPALLNWDKKVDIANAAEPHIKVEDFADKYLNI